MALTIGQVLTIVQAIHGAENWNLGSGSNRSYRNYFFARAIGCCYHGHPIYNPSNADTQWNLKKTSSGAVQSDDVTASTSNLHFYDLIVGAGAPGYSFSVTDLGIVTGQFVFAPPVPDPGVVDGTGSFGLNDFRYRVGQVTKIQTTGDQVIPGIEDACGEILTKGFLFWGVSNQTVPGSQASVRTFFGMGDGVNNAGISQAHSNAVVAQSRSSASRSHSLYINNDQSTSVPSHIASVVEFLPGSMRLNWIKNRADFWDINYLALGGEDLKTEVGSFYNPAGLGDVTISLTPGFGQVTGIILIATPFIGPYTGFYGGGNLPAIGFGMVDGDGPHQYSAAQMITQSPQIGYRTQRTDQVITAEGTVNNNAESLAATIVTLNVDNFVLNFTKTNSGVAAQGAIYYMAIHGPRVYSGSLIQPSSPTSILTALPFNPGALLVLSTQQVATTAIVSKAKYSIGASDGIRQSNIWSSSVFNSGTPVCGQLWNINRVFTKADLGTGFTGIGTVQSQASCALNHNGFTLTWLTADVELTQVLYLALEAGIFFSDDCDGAETLTLACSDGDAVLAEFYSDFLVSTGGIPPYTFAIITGALPDGLLLNPVTGEINGYPTLSGLFTFTVRVTDDDGRTLDVPCEINVGICPIVTSNNDNVESNDGDQINTPGSCGGGGGGGGGGGTEVTPFSGIYVMVPNKVNDSVYGPSGDPNDIVDVAIPNPFIETAFFPPEK